MNDIALVARWWITVTAVGWLAWPITKVVFESWYDKGYLFAKAAGLGLVTYAVWLIGTFRILPFQTGTIIIAGLLIFFGGYVINKRRIKVGPVSWRVVIAEEILFLSCILGWFWVKGHEPSINGLEKFMDYGFTNSILHSRYFPPADMWFSGEPINYYYFGHLAMAVITKLSSIDLAFGFNLMLVTLFALCFTLSFSIGFQLLIKFKIPWRIAGSLFVAYLVTLSGNLHTIYAYTSGYPTDKDPIPFWEILINPLDKKQRDLGWRDYWYPNATRFIPYTIHEFPSYSFVVSDVHGHVLGIPFALLAMALMVLIIQKKMSSIRGSVVYGWLVGIMFMTNALDGPIYLSVFVLIKIWESTQYSIRNLFFLTEKKTLITLLKSLLTVGGIFVITIIPFLVTFKSFVSGVAINCPPSFLANHRIGPILFEGTEKCQHSPLWMLLILWGFFGYAAIGFIGNRIWGKEDNERRLFKLWIWFGVGLLIFPEIFYFKDIYPQHFRSNTMFKLGYQVFIMMSILAGMVITDAVYRIRQRKWFLLGLLPLLYLVVIYPLFSVPSYFGKVDLGGYKGLYGLSWLQDKYPNDFAAIEWLNLSLGKSHPVVLEANGDSYTDYERISTFTGLPTVAGWTVHEWLWRGGYQPIADRNEEVRIVYESGDIQSSLKIIRKYSIKYIVVGDLERQKYPSLNEESLKKIARVEFESGDLKIYKVI